MSENLKQKTIEDFGAQWTTYTDNSGYYGSTALLADILEPLIKLDDLSGTTVAEIGSGTGRIVNMLCDSGIRKIYALEPSSAFSVLEANTRTHGVRVERLNVTGEHLPADSALDYVFSIGVIHHIPEPAPVLTAAYQALKPGGTCFIWLYGKEGNELYLSIFGPLRRITARLPGPVLSVLCHVLTAGLDIYRFFCRFLPLPLRDYVINVIGRFDRSKRYLVIYDQLNPAYAKYYTRTEAIQLLENAGFINVEAYHRHGYSWSVAGVKGP